MAKLSTPIDSSSLKFTKNYGLFYCSRAPVLPLLLLCTLVLSSQYISLFVGYVLREFKVSENSLFYEGMNNLSTNQMEMIRLMKREAEEIIKAIKLIKPENRSTNEYADMSKKFNSIHSTSFLSKKVVMQASIIEELNAKISALYSLVEKNEISIPSGDQDVRILGKNPQQWQQQHFQVHGSYGFVQFSSYRLSSNSFIVIGFGLLSHRNNRKIGYCRWNGSNSKTALGRLRAIFPKEHHYLDYEVMMMRCDLLESVDAGGYLLAKIDKEEMVVFREEEASEIKSNALDSFSSDLTVCISPLHGNYIEFRVVKEFISFHMLHGADHFVIYDAILSGSKSKSKSRLSRNAGSNLQSRLEEDVRSGLIEIVPFQNVEMFENWYHGQLLATHDCIFRSASSAQWVMIADIDEYLWVKPPLTLKSLLDKHADVAGVIHGAYWFSVFKCRTKDEKETEIKNLMAVRDSNGEEEKTAVGRLIMDPKDRSNDDKDADADVESGRAGKMTVEEASMDGDEFTVEKFSFRWPHPVCFENGKNGKWYDGKKCPRDKGHRKFIVNPRKIEKICIHGACNGDAAENDFEMLSTDVVVHAHFQYLTGSPWSSASICNTTVPVAEPVEWWKVDPAFSLYVRNLRKGYKCDFSASGCSKMDSK